MEQKKAVFLDRDGVINKAIIRNNLPFSPRQYEDFEFDDGIEELTRYCVSKGFILFVVTNQPDISRGKVDAYEINRMHRLILEALPVTDIFTCPHDDEDNCQCRKPKPGALIYLAKKYSISLPDSYIIGDRWKDIKAGQSANCGTIFINRGYHEAIAFDAKHEVKDLIECKLII